MCRSFDRRVLIDINPAKWRGAGVLSSGAIILNTIGAQPAYFFLSVSENRNQINSVFYLRPSCIIAVTQMPLFSTRVDKPLPGLPNNLENKNLLHIHFSLLQVIFIARNIVLSTHTLTTRSWKSRQLAAMPRPLQTLSTSLTFRSINSTNISQKEPLGSRIFVAFPFTTHYPGRPS